MGQPGQSPGQSCPLSPASGARKHKLLLAAMCASPHGLLLTESWGPEVDLTPGNPSPLHKSCHFPVGPESPGEQLPCRTFPGLRDQLLGAEGKGRTSL